MVNTDETVLLTDVTIVTVDVSRRVILNGCVLISGSRILHVASKAPASLPPDTRTISLPGRIIIPGLINTHAHLAQSILRGLAEDLPLHSWLCDRIWPLEASYQGDDGYAAARLTIAEMLLSGTTCFLEAMLTHGSGVGNVARAVEEMGIRACLGKLVKFVETNPALGVTDARDRDVHHMSIDSLLDAHTTHHDACDGRLQVWAACGTPRGAPLDGYAKVGEACKAHDIGITMHCAEAPGDLPIFHDVYNMSPMAFCRDAGLTSRKTVLAHMCHLDGEPDLAILAETGTSVAHNPTSNLKLASGIADVPAMLKAGVSVGLGTDGAPCNNSYDMLREMHLASILHRGVTLDVGSVGAHRALEMATIGGARALGLETEIGSIEVGKKADLVVLDLRGSWAAPWDPETVRQGGLDPVDLVVGSCVGRDVELVMVDGRILVEDRKLVDIDEGEIIMAARRAVTGIQSRSGVKATQKADWTYE